MAKARVVAKTGVFKQCCRCKVVKDTSKFHRSAPRRDGLQAYCRACKKGIDKEHNQRNPRRNYEHRRAYALRNLRLKPNKSRRITDGQLYGELISGATCRS